MNRTAYDLLVEGFVGKAPSPIESALKGAGSGVVLFLLFEYAGVATGNFPRIPVAWLTAVATVAAETVLFFRLVLPLRTPRRADFYFVMRLDYGQRIEITRRALEKTHHAFVPFTGTLLATAALLEAVVIGERSLMTLIVIPFGSLFFMAATAFLCRRVLDRRLIPCSRRDRPGDESTVVRSGYLRKRLAIVSVRIARFTARFAPPCLKTAVMRNTIYLVRGECVLTALVVVATPVALAPVLLFIGDPRSPFVTLLPLVAVFMMNRHFASELDEAEERAIACHWYEMNSRNRYFGYLFTLLLPSSATLAVFAIVAFPTFFSFYGVVRLINFLIAFAATVTIGCCDIRASGRKDSDPLVALMLFAIIAVGNFIPWAGALFSAASLLILFLLEGERFPGNAATGIKGTRRVQDMESRTRNAVTG